MMKIPFKVENGKNVPDSPDGTLFPPENCVAVSIEADGYAVYFSEDFPATEDEGNTDPASEPS